LRFQRVLRWDSDDWLFRLFRVIWDVGNVGDGKGYSNSFSFALGPSLFRWKREHNGWILTILGVRLHRIWSWGGRFT
jgi:hypothetical protein